MRAAKFTVSPITVYSLRRGEPMLPATTSPIWMPMPIRSGHCDALLIRSLASSISRAAATARCAGSAASSGAPNADDTLSDWSGSTITLPFRASVGLGVDDVGVSAGGVELPDCTGSFDNPTAPAGKLCVYPGREVDEAANVFFDDAEVANIAKNGEGAFEAYARPIGGGRYGVRIEAKAAAAGVAKFYATWAYTAP